ncbi:MAG: hypothetical protein AB7T27_11795 [Kiritimatiellia bacterium]
MREKAGSNIYEYGSRRGETKLPEYNTLRHSRRRRRHKSRVDSAARYILYFLCAAAAIGLAAYLGRLLTAGPEKSSAAPAEQAPQN